MLKMMVHADCKNGSFITIEDQNGLTIEHHEGLKSKEILTLSRKLKEKYSITNTEISNSSSYKTTKIINGKKIS